MSLPMIRLKKLEKSVPAGQGRLWLLRQIDLDVAAGEFIAVTGPSGAGKSTLLAILGLMDSDCDGEYWLDGKPVHQINAKARQALQREAIGFIFQQYHLIDDLTVAENLDLPLSYRNVPAGERKARVADILDRFQIVGKKDLYPKQLSGGQQQLVAVARATITRPKVLLADEPTGALHSSQGEMIMELLAELNRDGATIVMVTHNPANAARAQRRIELKDGWITGR
ncbi:MAG: ABC transporter ATP-binding protein [Xanthomonadales bacterium]|nr:Macrolide export ATP-binding/permease protein MacB [Xanthomonadales bacterium]MCC6594707.1 ABC transporter ATP-binding protein [Xanthomonadales bacterium]MCE7932017.1 ABC transporter ATP-binding protein [Xanthomonadales bacterium PRO6]